ncbi:MAG: tRNA pseudouridine(55) synthase TruB [Leptolyngbyaceae cyanobacterium SM1_1_3]|nr:tRNA pseudouridine(55) synthase TruB [Leptolyngbyaceae cyanobacterium SM1_1_3]NJN04903.1 tRNA pseudouridine(55) synthase TruB [Leptolyngbyaceae cyanobacterium RM1_1_2]NJO09409.1 tRNA pseudouridine(55) synthase TruB [Leptolyngbyaceae cyanobacterium SL_1_1]
MQGFLNLHKPVGFTSHDCVAKVRKLLGIKRVGHAGTLDPLATGVLPIAIGRATRLIQYLQPNKAYRAVIRFGLTTTTDDLEGEPLRANPVPDLQLEVVESALAQFQGAIAQVPPSHSAIQVGGQRLYRQARKGKAVVVPERTVTVYEIKVLNWVAGEYPELEVAIACGPGTYIRSVARDLGAAVGSGATLANLVRTWSSGLGLDNSLSLEKLSEQIQAGLFNPIAPAAVLQHLPGLTLPFEQATAWTHGQKVMLTDVTAAGDRSLRVEDPGRRFLGIGAIASTEAGKQLMPKMVFAPGGE